MRIRVGGQRIASAYKNANKKERWRKKGSNFLSANGRIMLKDLDGKSYMAMGFYNRIPMESTYMRIISLANNRAKRNNNSH